MRGRVDDDVLAERLQQLDDLHHVGRAHLVGERGLDGCRQDQQPALVVAHEQALEQLGVEPVDVGDGVDDRVLWRHLEHDGHVAELEVGVDEDDRAVGLAGQDDGEVGGDDGLARPTLGGEDGDHAAHVGGQLGGGGPRGGHRHHRDRVRDAVDGFQEEVLIRRQGDHVAHTGAEGLLQHGGGQLLHHHERADLRPVAGEPLHRLEPGRVRVRGPEHDDERGSGGELLLHRLDGRERGHRHALAQLHGEASAQLGVIVHDGDREASCGSIDGIQGSRPFCSVRPFTG